MSVRNSFVITLKNHFFMLEQNGSDQYIKRSAYISHSLDSMEEGTIWHRCKVNGRFPQNTRIYISYFARNKDSVSYQGEEHRFDELIYSSGIESQEKEAFLDGFWQETVINGTEFPLQKARGRYMWYKVEFLSYGGEHPEIIDIQVDFPLKPLTDYLPEIYQQGQESLDLLNRFLGIFQSLLDDMESQVKDISRYLDVERVDSDFLHWLCRWLDISNREIWPEEKLRKLLGNAFQLYLIKGTRTSIERIVEMYTGNTPFIVEYYDIEGFKSGPYRNLYGDNEYTFTVLVREECLPTAQHYLELKQIINSFMPAYTMLNLVTLRSYMILGSHIYLGVNSVLSSGSSLVLDDKASIPYNTTIENGGWIDEK